MYSIDASHWEYRDEGGANIVLGYIGKDKDLAGKILRIRKGEPRMTSDGLDEVVEIFNYTHEIIAKLFSDDLVDGGELAPVTPAEVAALNIKIDLNRPDHRKGVNVSENVGYVGIQKDMASTPSSWVPSNSPKITVELKPKWGFMTKSTFVSEDHKQVKSNTCRFCMHQHVKLAQGKINHISDYCPLDLYSGKLERVVKSLEDMLIEPQNNLKVYVGRTPALLSTITSLGTDTQTRLTTFAKVLSEGGFTCPSQSASPIKPFCTALAAIVMHTDVLQQIKAVQKLDVSDVEGYYKMYQAMKHEDPQVNVDGQWSSASWIAAKDSAKKTIFEMNSETHVPITEKTWSKLSKSDKKAKMREFLISTTLKDCSVMITFQRIESDEKPPNCVKDMANNTTYQYNVAIIDTDPKFFVNIPHYWETDQEIVDTFIATGSTRKCSFKYRGYQILKLANTSRRVLGSKTAHQLSQVRPTEVLVTGCLICHCSSQSNSRGSLLVTKQNLLRQFIWILGNTITITQMYPF
eukprot:CFRG2856T1